MGGPCTVGGVTYAELDNFLLCAFEVDGRVWTSVEQYFQAAKFLDPAYQETIRACVRFEFLCFVCCLAAGRAAPVGFVG